MTCRKCHGDGWLEVAVGTDSELQQCKDCRGSGQKPTLYEALFDAWAAKVEDMTLRQWERDFAREMCEVYRKMQGVA